MVDLKKRIAHYRQVLNQDPASRAYVPLADLLRQQGQIDEALALLEDGLSRNPEHQSAMVVLGHTLLQAGRRDRGVKILQRVLELSPDNFVVLRSLVREFLDRDGYTHAVPLLEKLVELEPEQEQWPRLLAEARETLAEDAARSQSGLDAPAGETAIPAGGSKDLATMTLVDILVAQGYLERALEALRQMQKRDPGREDIRERLRQLQADSEHVVASSETGLRHREAPASSPLERAQWRAEQKKQFGAWLDRLKKDEDRAS